MGLRSCVLGSGQVYRVRVLFSQLNGYAAVSAGPRVHVFREIMCPFTSSHVGTKI